MGWNFRKRIKLGEYLTLNIGKKGFSFTLGRKGCTLNVNDKGGVKRTVSIKGMGLSNTKKIYDLKGKKEDKE